MTSFDSYRRKSFTVLARHHKLILGPRTRIMGIINCTPDSFSGDGLLDRFTQDPRSILTHAKKLLKEGADLIDVGGESSRPGARTISEKEEIKRVIPVIKILAKHIKKPISIDSYKETVVLQALHHGASIVNTIKGTQLSPRLLKIIKRSNAAVILMHMRGSPRTMQKNTQYGDLLNEIIGELAHSIEKCFEFGIKSDKIIIDPGIGFGKSVGQNLEIIHRLREFETLGQPVLIGPSRKSFIGKILGTDPAQRLWGTASCACAGILGGAHIIRVHDVKEMREIADMTDALLDPGKWQTP